MPTRTRAFARSNIDALPCASCDHTLENGVMDVVEPAVEQRLAYGFEAESRGVRVNKERRRSPGRNGGGKRTRPRIYGRYGKDTTKGADRVTVVVGGVHEGRRRR